MPLYEVKEGATYTIGDRVHNPGETVDLTEGQAAPWLDLLLKPVVEPKGKRGQPRQESEVSHVG